MTLEQAPHNDSPLGSQNKDAQNGNGEQCLEHTLIGCAIGEIRDVFSAPSDVQNARERAKQNDEIGRIAVDVAVSLPRVNLVAAGVLHGLALIDPHENVHGNVPSFALNVASGLALNGVVRGTLPGSAVSRWAETSLGTGIQGQAASHLLTGAGFGLTRSAFDKSTWMDDSGQFSLAKGTERLAFSTVTSALTNVPAGFVGSSIGMMFASGAVDSALARTIAGVGSGFAAGGVFGLTDSVLSTGSITGGATAFLYGGLTGAFTGGLISGFPGGRLGILDTPRQSSAYGTKMPDLIPNSAMRDIHSSGGSAATAEDLPVVAGYPSRSWNIPALFKTSMEIKLPAFDSVSERYRKLPLPKVGTYKRDAVPPDTKYSTMKEFLASIHQTDSPAVIYRHGPTDIIVPTAYNAELQEVRRLRLEASRMNRLLSRLPKTARDDIMNFTLQQHRILDLERFAASAPADKAIGDLDQKQLRLMWPGLWPTDELPLIGDLTVADLNDTIDIFKAGVALQRHPLGTRALPEDVMMALDRMPNRGLIKSVEILNEKSVQDKATNEFDAWVQKHYPNGTFYTAADATKALGRIRLYAPKFDRMNQSLYSDLKHEQVHLNHSSTYDYARLLDQRIEASTYGYRNNRESEAELESLAFLDPRLGYFLHAAELAPVRMADLARKLTDTIEGAPAELRSLDQHEILARARFINKHVLPEVMPVVKDAAAADVDAVPLLVHLNNGQKDEEVQNILIRALRANQHTDIVIPELIKMNDAKLLRSLATSLLGNTTREQRSQIVGAMKKIASSDARRQADTLFAWAQSDSGIQAAVREYIMNTEPQLLQRRSAERLLIQPPGAATFEDKVRYTLEHGDDMQKAVAAYRIRQYNKQSDVDSLMELAKHGDKDYAPFALDSGLWMAERGNRKKQFDHLERMAVGDSPYKAAARKLIQSWGPGETRAETYKQLLTYLKDPKHWEYFYQQAADALNSLPISSPKKLWAQEIIQAIESAHSGKPFGPGNRSLVQRFVDQLDLSRIAG